ncbi:hypothetical protein Pint_18013 [Pistacia integerrima]|uniref:Uncharacterized protein n=1 Tax=Pistacia integerrima TaxID=434235 RepID=A0ACC0YTY2_9ROSI|nr:hypothetical protein Pint_18013 [Pistacia integerrima]
MPRPPNYEFQEWWNKQRDNGHEQWWVGFAKKLTWDRFGGVGWFTVIWWCGVVHGGRWLTMNVRQIWWYGVVHGGGWLTVNVRQIWWCGVVHGGGWLTMTVQQIWWCEVVHGGGWLTVDRTEIGGVGWFTVVGG